MTTRITPGVGANLLGQHASERNQDATAYVGNLDAQATEELLWELFVQAGPVVNVYVPKDRVTNLHQGYGFVEFRSEEDADYAIKILNMIKLYGKPIRVNKASQDRKSLDVGANLFVGNLDPDVDEKLLYDTFSAFGVIVTNPKIMRDPDTGNSRGFGFISYDSFEASDAAIEAMNGQYLCNRPITVSYAYKKDTKGERHGTPAERLLAANNPNTQKSRPHTLFASGPPIPAAAGGPPPMPPQASGNMGPPPSMNGGMPPPFNNGPPMPPPPLHQRQMAQTQSQGPPFGPPPIQQGGVGRPQQWPNQLPAQGQGMPSQIPQQHFRPPPPPGSRPLPPNMLPPQQNFTGPGGRPPPPMGMGPGWPRGAPPPPPQANMRGPPPPPPQMQGMPHPPINQPGTQGMPPPPPRGPGMPPPQGMRPPSGSAPSGPPPPVGSNAPPPPPPGPSAPPPPPGGPAVPPPPPPQNQNRP
eukprot:c27394_g2_i1 orf=1470-2876(+)